MKVRASKMNVSSANQSQWMAAPQQSQAQLLQQDVPPSAVSQLGLQPQNLVYGKKKTLYKNLNTPHLKVLLPVFDGAISEFD